MDDNMPADILAMIMTSALNSSPKPKRGRKKSTTPRTRRGRQVANVTLAAETVLDPPSTSSIGSITDCVAAGSVGENVSFFILLYSTLNFIYNLIF